MDEEKGTEFVDVVDKNVIKEDEKEDKKEETDEYGDEIERLRKLGWECVISARKKKEEMRKRKKNLDNEKKRGRSKTPKYMLSHSEHGELGLFASQREMAEFLNIDFKEFNSYINTTVDYGFRIQKVELKENAVKIIP